MTEAVSDEQKRRIREQQKSHSELLAAAKSSIGKLETRGRALVELLPSEKQIAPLNFFLSISAAGIASTQCSQEFTTNETLANLATALTECAKEVHSTIAKGRQALHASGSAMPLVRRDVGTRRRKDTCTSKLQEVSTGVLQERATTQGRSCI